ncbi:hypothetical protein N658DRAFT_423546, partial [Parathielavia hyrcaniae]
VDIASLLKDSDSNESPVSSTQPPPSNPAPAVAAVTAPPSGPPPAPAAARPGSGGGKRGMPPHTAESPAKRQSKWSAEEDAKIIDLRGSGMKWDDISKHLPGRSSISCRLHYQNYLERRAEWDEERKNKLARLYERFKPDMWARVAEELQVPWRAAEAMHWQLGEIEMARRAGVVPFSLNIASNEPQGQQRISPTRGHTHSQSQGSLPRDFAAGLPSPRYTRTLHPPPQPPPQNVYPLMPPPTQPTGRSIFPRRESLPPPGPFGPPLVDHSRGNSNLLPSVAELTTGVGPYSTPAYTHVRPPPPPPPPPPSHYHHHHHNHHHQQHQQEYQHQQQQHHQQQHQQQQHQSRSSPGSPGQGGTTGNIVGSGPLTPACSTYHPLQLPPPEPAVLAGKRRASPPDEPEGAGPRETSRRRQ